MDKDYLRDYVIQIVEFPEEIQVDIWHGSGDDQWCDEIFTEIEYDHLVDYIDENIDWEYSYKELLEINCDREKMEYLEDIKKDVGWYIKNYLEDEDVILHYMERIRE